jgi:uncharacterized LabA/DUF88 family protein
VSALVLPKAGSGAFKELAARVQKTLDLPRMVVVVEGALDRKQLEDAARRILRGRPVRSKAHSKSELVGLACEALFRDIHAAYVVMKALDKSSNKERHIVASIDDEIVEERLLSYRALEFRRERTRLIWALVRDGRPNHVAAAEKILAETFAAMRPVRGEVTVDQDEANKLEAQLQRYEAALQEQGELMKKEQDTRAAVESERSELMAKLGLRERQLKEEQERRRDADGEVKRLRGDLKELTEKLEEADTSKLEEVKEERDRLLSKARALESRLEHAEKLAELDDENAALREELQQLRDDAEQRDEQHREQVRLLSARERAAHERVRDLRASLKTARQLAAAPRDPSVTEGEPVVERVGVFVDAENIVASARRDHGGNFDFRAMLPALVGERRKKAMAVAFVVDKDKGKVGGSDFSGFVRALQAAGYEVRQKKPRVRKDGSSKADWDMGIAMEIIDARNKLDVVVLCSGDGDFVPLVQRLKRWRRRVEVAAFTNSTQQDLIRAADEFVDLTGRFKV